MVWSCSRSLDEHRRGVEWTWGFQEGHGRCLSGECRDGCWMDGWWLVDGVDGWMGGKTEEAAGSEPGGLVRGDLTLVLRQNSYEGAGVESLGSGGAGGGRVVLGRHVVTAHPVAAERRDLERAVRQGRDRQRCPVDTGIRARRSRADGGGGRECSSLVLSSRRVVAGAEVLDPDGYTTTSVVRGSRGFLARRPEFVRERWPGSTTPTRVTAWISRCSASVGSWVGCCCGGCGRCRRPGRIRAARPVARRSPWSSRRATKPRRCHICCPDWRRSCDRVTNSWSSTTTRPIRPRRGPTPGRSCGAPTSTSRRLARQATCVLDRDRGRPRHRCCCSSTPTSVLHRICSTVWRSPSSQHPGTVVSVQPWHDTGSWVEQASLLANVTALMGSGGFTVAGSRLAPTVAFGPVLAVERSAYDAVGGHAAVRAMHTEDIGLARVVGRSALWTGRPDTSFRMYPDGLRQLVQGWTRSIATGARFTPWWLSLAVALWVWSLAGGWLAEPLVYPLSALQLWVLGRRAGSMHPLTAAALPAGGRRVRRDLPAQPVRDGVPARRDVEAALGPGPPRLTSRRLAPCTCSEIDQDLADVGVGLHVAVGVGDVVEGVTRIDHRAQRTDVEQREHLVDEALAQRQLAFERAGPQRGADPRDPLRQDQPDVDRRVGRRPSGRPARSCRPSGPPVRLRSTSSPPITSSTTSTPPGTASAQRAEPVGRAAFEHDVGAEFTAGVDLAGRAGDRDPGTDRLRDLDAGGADAGRAGVHERPPTRW